MIPRLLHRVIPATVSRQTQRFWAAARQLHPGWEARTHQDPLTPAEWPITAPVWDRCTSGAQLAGLVRLEALARYGGIYLDSDVEVYRSLDPLRHTCAFAAWEDADTVPDAILGATPNHPAILDCLALALLRIRGGDANWRTGAGTWATGPGVTTTVLPGRNDILLLPPGAFYPYHWADRDRRYDDHRKAQPWCFAAHHWAASWL